MLTITVGGQESYDEVAEQFVTEGGTVLQLEHSLVSLSKWEAEFEKAFLEDENKTPEELLGYVRAMTLTPDIPPEVFAELTDENMEKIATHINAKMTATWFSESPTHSRSSEVVTSELIYYWMTALQIPFTCETWHLNRLFTLIRVCNIKQQQPKKMSRAEIASRQRELNAQRRLRLNSTG